MADSGRFYGRLPVTSSAHGGQSQPICATYPAIPDYATTGNWYPPAIPPDFPTFADISGKLNSVLEMLSKQNEEIKTLKDDNASMKKDLEVLKVQGSSTTGPSSTKKEKLPTGLSVRVV